MARVTYAEHAFDSLNSDIGLQLMAGLSQEFRTVPPFPGKAHVENGVNYRCLRIRLSQLRKEYIVLYRYDVLIGEEQKYVITVYFINERVKPGLAALFQTREPQGLPIDSDDSDIYDLDT